MARPPQIRRKPVNPFNRAALGIYKGPPRTIEPPKVTPYRLTLLRAVEAGEVKAGQGQYMGAWRWHHGGTSVTCTKWIREFVGCGWARPVGAHVELTDAGKAVLENAPDRSACATGKVRYPSREAADKALLNGAYGKHSYECKGCGGWHTTSKPLLSLPGGRSTLSDSGRDVLKEAS